MVKPQCDIFSKFCVSAIVIHLPVAPVRLILDLAFILPMDLLLGCGGIPGEKPSLVRCQHHTAAHLNLRDNSLPPRALITPTAEAPCYPVSAWLMAAWVDDHIAGACLISMLIILINWYSIQFVLVNLFGWLAMMLVQYIWQTFCSDGDWNIFRGCPV